MSRALLLLLLLALSARGQDPRATLEAARAEEQGVLQQLNSIDRELEVVQSELDALALKFRDMEDEERRLQDTLASAEAVTEVYRHKVGTRLAALYKLKRRGLARLVFGADDATDLRRRAYYLYRIVQADKNRLAAYAKARATQRDAMEGLERNQEALQATRTELQLKEAELKDEKARRVALVQQIRTRAQLALQAISQQRTTRQQLQQYLSTSAVATPAQAAQTFRNAYGKLVWPVSTGKLVRRMGAYTDPLTGQQKSSSGIDISASFGTPFRAVFPGRVHTVEFFPGYGQTVVVDHGADYTTVYAHANGVQVRRGQQVQAGDVLGNVGNTGLTDSDGYILTFEVRYKGTPQDPLDWLGPQGRR